MPAASSGSNIDIAINVQGGPEATKAAEQVGAAYEQMGTKVEQSATKTETAFSRMDRSAKSPLGNINKGVQETVKQTGALSSTGSKNVTDFGNSFTKGLGGAPAITSKFTEGIDKTNKSTASLTQTGRSLGSSMTALVGSFAAVGGSAIALFEAYDSVGDAQLNVEKASVRLETAQRILMQLQYDLVDATQKYGAGSQQVIEIQAKLAEQQNKVSVATGDLENAQENLAITQTHFYKEILPITISSLGTLTVVMSQSKETWKVLKESVMGLIPALRGASVAMNLMKAAPILLPLTLLSGIIVAFTSNLFGFRDAINNAGKALADMLPFLKPFLDMLGSLGQFLTQTFGGGIEEAQGFEQEFTAAMEGAGTSGDILAQGVGAGVDQSVAKLQELITEAKTKKQELIDAMPTAVELAPGTVIHGTQDKPHKLGTGFDDFNKGRDVPESITIPGEEIGKPQQPPQGTSKEIIQQWKDYHAAINQWNNSGQKTKDIQFGINEMMKMGEMGVLSVKNAEGKRVVDMDKANAALLKMGFSQSQAHQALLEMNTIYGVVSVTGQEYSQAVQEQDKNIQKATAGIEELTGANAQQSIGQQILAASTTKLNEEFLKNKSILETSGAATTLYNHGVEKLVTDIIASNIELKQSEGYWNAYSEALKLPSVQLNEFNKGVIQQRQALVESKTHVLQTAGAYSELVEQMATGEPQTIAYTQAVYDQKIALEQAKVEVFALQGTFDTLIQQYASGEQSVVAFNKGFIEQKTSMIQTAIAVDTTRGAITALAQDMDSGFAQQVAWNKGLEEGRLAILQNTIALEEREGRLTAMREAMEDGTLIEQTAKEAVIEHQEALLQSILSIEKMATTLKEYEKSLKLGIPQSLAFAAAQQKVKMESLQLIETFASLAGEYTEVSKNLKDAEYIMNITNNAFMKGQLDVQKWAISIQEANANSQGMTQQLIYMAHGLENDFPKALYGSTQAMQEWVALSLQMPDAIDRGLSSAIDKAKSAIDSLTEAWKKGSNLSGKEIEKILGLNLPKEIDQELNMHFKIKSNESEMKQSMVNLIGVMGEMGSDLSAKSAVTIVDSMKRGLKEKLNDGEISENFYSYFTTLLDNMPDPTDTVGFAAWIGQFNLLAEAIDSNNPAAIDAILQSMVSKQAEVQAAAQAIENYSTAIDTYLETIQNKPKLTPDETAVGTDLMLGLVESANNKYKPGENQAQPGTVDTSGIDAAMEKLNTWNLAIAAIPGTITTIVGEANTALQPLGDPLVTDVAAKISAFLNAMGEVPGWITSNVVGPINTSLTPIGDPLVTTVASKISAFLNAMGDVPGWITSNVTNPIIGAFNTMANSLQSGPFSKIQRDAGNAFVAVTNIARAEAPKLANVYDSAITTLITKMAAIQNAADRIFPAVTRQAEASARAVSQLANSINSLQNKTVTLTTVHVDRYETQYAAAGFGPTVVDHPTHILVGESGPEFVNVTPLNSTGGKNLGANERLNIFNDPGKKRINPAPIMLANGTDGIYTAFGTSNINTGSVPAISSTTYDMRLLFVGLNKLITDAVPVEIIRSNVGLGGVGGGSSGGSGGSSSQTNTGTNSQSSMIVSPGSIINQGNNVNISNDSNSNNNVAPNGQIIQGSGSSGSFVDNGVMGSNTGSPTASGLGNISGSGGNYYYQNQNGRVNTNIGSNSSGTSTATGAGSNTSATGALNNGGMVVDGQNGRVIMNGMIVDGKTGTVIMTGNGSSSGGGLGGIFSGPGAGIGGIYPINARTGSSIEPLRGPYRSGQDNQNGIYDSGRPNPYQDMGVYTGGSGSTIGLPGLPGGLGAIFDFINKLISQIFGGLKLNQSFNLQLDSDFIGRSMFNNITTTLATIQR